MQALAEEFGPANPATREAVARLAAAREAPPSEWSELFAGVEDPRGELAALYGVAGPPDALLFAVHTHFARVADDVREGRIAGEPGTDVLRDLYQRLVPSRVRGALGEFLTPPWLAAACLDRLEELGAPLTTGRVLDPTCGTGTFLLPVLMRKLAAGGDVQAILDSLAGYDLNPVALQAARANFVVALGGRYRDGLRLPLHRADATRDAPAGTFDVIVGNPPWIGWRRLSAQRREAGMATWKRYGLWHPPAENGRRPANPPMGDLATLVYASAVARHCATGGHVGMLVPHALLIGDPGGRAFRRFEVGGRRFAPLHADLYDAAEAFAPDASNQPVFLVSRVGAQARYPVMASRWSRGRAETKGLCRPVDRDVATSQWSFAADGTDVLAGGTNGWRFGVGFHTRGANGVYFVEVLEAAADGRVEIANLPRAGRDPAVRRRRGRVEAALVYPLLRGRDVSRWRAEPAGHVFAPYRQAAMGAAVTDFAAAFPDGHRWLSSFRPVLRNRRLVPTLRWDLDGDDWPRLMGTEHMTGAPCVVVRELGRRPAAAVVLPREDERLGRRATVLIDHKLLYCAVATEDEAHYLAAMINATPMQDLLASFLNVVGVAPGTLARLPIPPYDPARAAALVAAAKDAADARVDAEAGRLLHGATGGAVTERDVPLADGRTVRVYDSGGEGEVVVWHHGSPQTGAPLAPVLEAALARGLRHVSYARPSYGGSSPQPGRAVADAARDVEQVAYALGFERFATLGALRRRPARARLRGAARSARHRRRLPRHARALHGGLRLVRRHGRARRAARRGRDARATYAETEEFDPKSFTSADWAALEGPWASLGEDAMRAGQAGPDGLVDDDVAFAKPWGYEVTGIRAPVLLAQGLEDRVVPHTHAEHLLRAVPDAELWLRRNDGHVSILDATPPALDWLRARARS